MKHKHLISDKARDRLSEFVDHLRSFDFYRKRIAALDVASGTTPAEVLDALPVMSGSDLPELMGSAMHRLGNRAFLADRTTGTTGEPKIRLATKTDDNAEASICREFFHNCAIGDRDSVVAIDMDSADIYIFYQSVLRDLGVDNFIYFNSDGSEQESLRRVIAGRSVLISVPTLVAEIIPILCELDESKRLKLRTLIFIGESMPFWMRRKLRDLGIETYSFFGATEIGSVGGECAQHNGLHLWTDQVIPTILDAVTLDDVVRGEVAWTTLHFRDFPLVKYVTGDRVSIDSIECNCGNRSPRITELARVADHFSLFGHTFEHSVFEDAIASVVGALRFVQIELLGRYGRPDVIFWLPDEVENFRSAICDSLRATDELGYFDQRGLLQLETRYVSRPIGSGRKMKRVLDRRIGSLYP